MSRLIHQTGLSLVELMIAMLLASIITSAAIAMLVSDSQASRYQISQASTHASGRFAFDFILADLRKAGYSDKTKIVTAVSGVNGAGNASDSLTISYDGVLTSSQSCVGTTLVGGATNNPAVNTYTVDANTLLCNGSPLMRGVEAFQILFGIDTNNDDDELPERYVQPGTIAAGERVVTVQIAMLVSTMEQDGERVPRSYQLLDTSTGELNDGRSRTVFTATERIRNADLDVVL